MEEIIDTIIFVQSHDSNCGTKEQRNTKNGQKEDGTDLMLYCELE
jgi:hypothetical protein